MFVQRTLLLGVFLGIILLTVSGSTSSGINQEHAPGTTPATLVIPSASPASSITPASSDVITSDINPASLVIPSASPASSITPASTDVITSNTTPATSVNSSATPSSSSNTTSGVFPSTSTTPTSSVNSSATPASSINTTSGVFPSTSTTPASSVNASTSPTSDINPSSSDMISSSSTHASTSGTSSASTASINATSRVTPITSTTPASSDRIISSTTHASSDKITSSTTPAPTRVIRSAAPESSTTTASNVSVESNMEKVTNYTDITTDSSSYTTISPIEDSSSTAIEETTSINSTTIEETTKYPTTTNDTISTTEVSTTNGNETNETTVASTPPTTDTSQTGTPTETSMTTDTPTTTITETSMTTESSTTNETTTTETTTTETTTTETTTTETTTTETTTTETTTTETPTIETPTTTVPTETPTTTVPPETPTTTPPTSPPNSVAVDIVAGVLGLLLLGGLLAVGAVMYRQGKLPWYPRNSNASVRPQAILLSKFETHCNQLLETPARLDSEYRLMLTLSSDIHDTNTVAAAQLPDNKKKNRYVNILPYDLTRVKLEITNDDPSSDYINASFIKGFSNNVEYIASQGPKEETVPDFWRMIYQHNVQLIVMVTNLEEGGKPKCASYLPKLREQMTVGGIIVRCGTELHFPIHTQRSIVLHKDDKKRNITHLHFNEWPDFGCPEGTDSMLQFCRTIRHCVATSPPGLVLVHCSAGVGRTGTLIATDFLLQHIQDNKKVDVFGTVFNLRKQRTNMVQTIAQYAYIYKCIREAILDPTFLKRETSLNNSMEPIYENVPTQLTTFSYEKLPQVKGKSTSSESECEL